MRRVGLLALVLLPAVLAGCGGVQAVESAPPHAAGVQDAELGWVEKAGSARSGLVFRVGSFSVTRGGWHAELSVTNDTDAAFAIDGLSQPFEQAFGLMVFGTGLHSDLERRDRQLDLPVLRNATTIEPALPSTLRPHATWSGTVASTGALPAGTWVRLVFGAFAPTEAMPASLRAAGVRDAVVWITDHAHRLR